jgi:hypothetical protein
VPFGRYRWVPDQYLHSILQATPDGGLRNSQSSTNRRYHVARGLCHPCHMRQPAAHSLDLAESMTTVATSLHPPLLKAHLIQEPSVAVRGKRHWFIRSHKTRDLSQTHSSRRALAVAMTKPSSRAVRTIGITERLQRHRDLGPQRDEPHRFPLPDRFAARTAQPLWRLRHESG